MMHLLWKAKCLRENGSDRRVRGRDAGLDWET